MKLFESQHDALRGKCHTMKLYLMCKVIFKILYEITTRLCVHVYMKHK